MIVMLSVAADQRLCAGAGYDRIKKLIKRMSSALIALSVNHKFDKYVFCDEDEKCLVALKDRATRYFPEANAGFVQGDSYERMEDVIKTIPKAENLVGERILKCHLL